MYAQLWKTWNFNESVGTKTVKQSKVLNCVKKGLVNFVYFYIALNNQELYLLWAFSHLKLQPSRATTDLTWLEQNYPLTNAVLNYCIYYLPTDNLWQFPPTLKTAFQSRAERNGKKTDVLKCTQVEFMWLPDSLHFVSPGLLWGWSHHDELFCGKNGFVWNLCCCRSFSVAQINLYLHVSLNLFSYLYNSKLPKVTQSQRATAQHKHYLTEPEVTPRFCEASGYHSLGFLPAECKKEYGIKKGHPDSLISKAQATELQGDLRGPGCILSMNETLAQDYKSRDWFDIAHYSSMPE